MSQLDLEGWTVNTGTYWPNNLPSGGNPQISVNGKLDATAVTGDIAGGILNWSTVGTNTNISGLMLRLEPGFTGAHTVRVIDAQNLVAGAAGLALQDIGGTIGVAAESQGASTGDNIGVYSIAGFATGRNVAGVFRSYQDSPTTPGTNIGVLSVAGHYGDAYNPTPTAPEIGGYFSIGTYYDPRPNLATSSALIADNGNMTAVPIFIARVNGTNAFQITGTGGVLDRPSADSTSLWQIQNHAGTTFFNVDSTNQRVGIGTTTPWRTLSVSGTVGLAGLTNGFGAGSLCLTANKEVVYNAGSDNCLSSLRATKHDISPLALSATSTIRALSPVSFIYNGDASSTVRYGFIAEDTATVDQHLATYDQTGALTGVDDRAILSVIVKALQELIATVAGFAERITTQTLVADNGTFQKVSTQELCVGATCVTESQLRDLLQKERVSPSTAPAAPSGTTTATASSSPAPSLTSDASTSTATTTADAPSIVPDYNAMTTVPAAPPGAGATSAVPSPTVEQATSTAAAATE